MALNSRQLTALLVGLTIAGLMVFVPPWETLIVISWRFSGFHSLLDPPHSPPSHTNRIALKWILPQLLVVVVFTRILVLYFRDTKRRSIRDRSRGPMLLIALLVAVLMVFVPPIESRNMNWDAGGWKDWLFSGYWNLVDYFSLRSFVRQDRVSWILGLQLLVLAGCTWSVVRVRTRSSEAAVDPVLDKARKGR